MPKEIAIVAAAAILAVGIVGGCFLIAGALNDLCRLLGNLNIVVNHRHIQEMGGTPND